MITIGNATLHHIDEVKLLTRSQRCRLRKKGFEVPFVPRQSGYKQSPELIEKRAAALRKGASFSCQLCSSKFWRAPSAIAKNENKYCSRECFKKSQIGKPKSEAFKNFCKSRVGDRSPTWKGGLTPKNVKIRNSKEMSEWRLLVFKRDLFICQDCMSKCGNGKNVVLHAHHIKSFSEFPELRFAVVNGITLCKECHYKRHTK